MRDMIPPGDRSIRNIPVSRRASHQRPADEAPAHRRPRRRIRRFWLWAIVVVAACVAAGLLFSVMFSGAAVTVHPRTQMVQVPSTLEARLNAPVGTLEYQTFSVSRSGTTTAPATGSQKVSKQASGLVTVYNAYSTAPQRLIANTRLQAPDGKIYRIRDSVVVPGGTQKADKTLAPGSVTVTVYADSPGAEYNRSGSTTFTIPGFQGDPRYTKFYAQSQGDISGGFVGTQASVAPADLAAAKTALEQTLTTSVTAAVNGGVPEGYIVIPGTVKVTYGDIVQVPNGDRADVAETATASGAVLKLSDLATALARGSVAGYNGEAVSFEDATGITISASTTSSGTLPQSITLRLSGTPTLVWQFDAAAVRNALVGKTKSQFQEVLQSFAPAIDCTAEHPCDAKIRPFWSSAFPTDSSKISVVGK